MKGLYSLEPMSSHSSDSSPTPGRRPPPSEASPSSPPAHDDGVLDRYFLGQLRAEEAETVTYFFSDPARTRLLQRVRRWVERDEGAESPDPSRTFALLWERIHENTPRAAVDIAAANRGQRTATTSLNQSAGWRFRHWRGVALSLGVTAALVVGVGIFGTHARHPAGMSRTYTTGPDQRATIALPDGTHASLAPASTLQFADFGARSRTVVLHGEAYFDVTRQSGTPFIVRSGAFSTRVLGTAFTVIRRDHDARMRVAVSSGKVYLATTTVSPGITLTGGQVGVADSITRVAGAVGVDIEAERTADRLVFHHAPVSKVLDALSRWYGYQFRYPDPAWGERKVNIGVSTQSSADALAALERVLVVNLTIVGDTVTLIPQSARPRGIQNGTPRNKYDVWTPNREVGR